jgi:ring-1,2-phenylacetyl-CoA epoxidase subunit PaaE
MQQSASHNASFHLLQVSEIIALTSEAVEITLEVPNDLKPLFEFVPGQHLLVEVDLDGKTYRRSYSLCNAPGDALSLGVKRVPGGLISTYLTTQIKIGDCLKVSLPLGSFRLNPDAAHLVLIGAGSGITPLLSMYRQVNRQKRRVSLLYGNQTRKSTMFLESLTTHNTYAHVSHFYSREQTAGHRFGRINNESLSSFFAQYPDELGADAYYLCGPADMIETVRLFLEGKGISTNIIHSEYFKAPDHPELVLQADEASPTCHMRVILEGDCFEVNWSAEAKSLLDQLCKNNINAPFSCKKGVCGSCRAKVIQGSVNLYANYALTDEELLSGYTLTCQCVPTTPELEISFDD